MRTLKDGIFGLAVGDAMGLPVQFLSRGSYQITEMTGDGTYHLPAGTWSDDTSLTLALCDSIKKTHKIDVTDIRKRFEDWLYRGAYTPYGKAFDVGGTCYRAITTGKGQTGTYSNGNGSLMRILPLAFVNDCTDTCVADVSSITHADRISVEGCIAYIKVARGLLEGKSLQACIQEAFSTDSIYARVLSISSCTREEIRSSGYVVDTMEAAMWCLLTTDSYKDCILKAVNLGEDTDTIGAVAGGLAGIIYGYESIPKEWILALKAKNCITQVLFF